MNGINRDIRGFTTLELIIVIAMITILAAVATPNINEKMADLNLGGEARNVLAVLQQARLKAVQEYNFVVVSFDPDGNGVFEGNYIAFIDDGATRYKHDAGEQIFYNGSLAKGIEITAADFTDVAGDDTFVCFNRRGYPLDGGLDFDGFVTLKNRKNSTRKIEVELAGNIKISN